MTSHTAVDPDPTVGLPTPRRAPRRPRRVFWWVLLGCLLVQAAWIWCMPPFSGPDEHEHAYRAAAVARGDVSLEREAAPGGWGELVLVPPALAAAGAPVCASLDYIPDSNCVPGPARSDGLVPIASSAARYDPAYYAVVGTASRIGHGDTSFYAMRIASAVLCALLLAAAFATTWSWSRSAWPCAGLVVAMTPTMWHASAVVAPNGVEMCAAALTWSAVLGVVARGRSRRPPGGLLVALVAGAVPLVTVRALGPLWFALIILVGAVLLGRPGVTRLARGRGSRVAAAVVLAAGLLAVVWSLAARPNSVGSDRLENPRSLATVLPREWVLWFLQSVAALPARNVAAPTVVYALVLTTWAVLVTVAVRRGLPRERMAIAATVVLASAVPLAATAAVYSHAGTVWQGRYGYPFSMGVLLNAAAVLDRATSSGTAARVALHVGTVTSLGATAVSLRFLLDRELDRSPLSGTDQWHPPPTWAALTLVIVGILVVASAVRPARAPAPT